MLQLFCTPKDVKQERRHSELMTGLEHFDKEHFLKHAETSEKVVLPNAQGFFLHVHVMILQF